MPFSAQELDNLLNAALDYHFEKGKVFSQTIQNRPLFQDFVNRMKEFPSGKDYITVRVKGDYTTTIQGFSGDDTVTYGNPANIKTANYPWKEIHWGIKVTLSELKRDGISFDDTAMGKSESMHEGREMTALANLFEDKIEDMKEGGERGMNLMFWNDGASDSTLVPGIRSFITTTPTAAAVVGGLDQSTYSWWRNRVSLGLSVSSPADQVIVQTLQREFRQLRRYGSPKHKVFCGSDFLDAFEKELRAKGNYTLDGWSKSGRIDASVADVQFKNVPFEYDPTLDDLGLGKYCYVLDMNAIIPMVMTGENFKKHSPARPADKYVVYRAMTWTGGLVCKQRNTSGVYTIA